MTRIELKSKVGPDGVLTLSTPVGKAEANREVKLIVECVEETAAGPAISDDEWKKFIEETAGSWQGEPLVRPEQGGFSQRRRCELM